MKKAVTYIFIFLIVLFLAALYFLRLYKMGIAVDNIIVFVILFAVTVAIAGLLILLFTRGIRKKLDNEMKNGEDNDD